MIFDFTQLDDAGQVYFSGDTRPTLVFVFGKMSFVVEQCGPLVADRVVGGIGAGRAGAAAVIVDRRRRRSGE